MKLLQKLSFLTLGLGLVFLLGSCDKNELQGPTESHDIQVGNPDITANMTEGQLEKFEMYLELYGSAQKRLSLRAPIEYLQELCGGDVVEGTAIDGSINNLADRSYYYFSGEAGDVVTIQVDRVSCDMDPFFSLYSGTYEDTDNLPFQIAFGDDELPPACSAGCFAYRDPLESGFVLPSTGSYTLAVGDYIACAGSTGPYTYSLIFTSDDVDCDADDDGCLDDVDPHPESNVEATVIIDGCDSGVANIFVSDDGCSTMSDLIADCAADATNHGEFVSCVSGLTNAWKNAGIISGSEKGSIQSCAAQSNLP